MSIVVSITIRYECRKCGWRWVLPRNVKMNAEITKIAGDRDPFSRVISVPKGKCCREES